MKSLRHLNQAGTTIVELGIAVSVATLVSILMFLIFTTFYGSVLRADAESRLVVESQIILRNIVDEMRIATSIRDTNQNSDPNEPSGGWATDLNNAILIIAIPARNDDKEFIINDLTGEPYTNEIVYFADEGTLYRRAIPDTAATGNTLGPTCPEALATSSCIADRVLTENFENLTFMFYDQDDVITTVNSEARSVDMTIDMKRVSFSGDITIENNIRMTMRN